MNVRRTRKSLNIITACLVVLGVAVLVLAFLLPPPQPPEAQPTVIAVAPSSAAPELPPREAFEPLLALDLRRPLYDAVPVVAAAAAKIIPPLRLKLVGTVVEPPGTSATSGGSYAIFTNGQGKTQFLSPGETAEEATILTVTETTVTLRYYEQEQTLSLEPPEGKSPEAKAPEAGKRP